MRSMEQRIYAVKQALAAMAKEEDDRMEMLLMLIDELDRALEDI